MEASTRRRPVVVAVALLLVVALVAGSGYVLFGIVFHRETEVSTPDRAGGMKRDTATEQQLALQLRQATQEFETQGKGLAYVRSAVYQQTDADRGPRGPVVFLGAKLEDEQDPEDFVRSFGKQAEQSKFTVEDVDPGGGGSGVCAVATRPQPVAICAWATEDSMGELIPTTPGYTATKLSALMRDVRADVETR